MAGLIEIAAPLFAAFILWGLAPAAASLWEAAPASSSWEWSSDWED